MSFRYSFWGPELAAPRTKDIMTLLPQQRMGNTLPMIRTSVAIPLLTRQKILEEVRGPVFSHVPIFETHSPPCLSESFIVTQHIATPFIIVDFQRGRQGGQDSIRTRNKRRELTGNSAGHRFDGTGFSGCTS